MFFVVCAGRSGSQTIARFLAQSPDCFVLHEPEPVFVKEATLYQYGLISHEMMKAIVLCTRPPFIKGKIYGESNHKLATLIPVLADAFPEARFIWLVRDGRDVVASTFYAREWYKAVDEIVNRPSNYPTALKEWTWYRLRGDLTGDMSTAQWEALTRFEKNCWLWRRTNEIIREHLYRLPQERWRLVRLEELRHRVRDVCEFLEITPPPAEAGKHNVSPVEPTRWPQWPPFRREAFEKWAGSEMDRLYPGWRDVAGNWHPTPSKA